MSTTPTLRLHSSFAFLTRSLRGHLVQTLGASVAVETRTEPTTSMVLMHRPTVDAALVEQVRQALRPFEMVVEVDPSLDTDIAVHLGSEKDNGDLSVTLHVDSEQLAERVGLELEEFGLTPRVILGHQTAPCFRYGSAGRFARACIAWALGHHDVYLDEDRGFASTDNDVWLYVSDPAAVGRSPQDRYPVQIRTDERAAATSLSVLLAEAGFLVQITPLPWEDTPRSAGRFETPGARVSEAPRFALRPGPFEKAQGGQWKDRLHRILETFLDGRGLGADRFPIESHEEPGLTAIIDLPLRAVEQGALRAYGPDCLDAFRLDVHTDDEELAGPVIEHLRSLGLREVNVRLLRGDHPLRLRCPSEVVAFPALQRLRQQIDMAVGLVGEASVPVELRHADLTLEQLSLYLPLGALRDGTLRERLLASTGRYKVRLMGPRGHEPHTLHGLIEALRREGFEEVDPGSAPSRGEQLEVLHGGAPDVILDRVNEHLRAHGLPTEPRRKLAWSEDDCDIFIHLPSAAFEQTDKAATESPARESLDLEAWVHGEATLPANEAPTALLEVTPAEVRIGPQRLTRRAGPAHPLAPAPHGWEHYALDTITAGTLLHIARAVALREPCLLEGETSTSKTSAVLFLAAQLGQPVVRVNLNGQTDTGELLGRYVPREDGEAGQGTFRWHDGVLVQAMREGHWLLLDEVNLAEPQILERLNPVLERDPSLVLTEHEGEVIAASHIHPDFRLFATMNPASYAGRSPLSPAYRDRWRAHRVVPSPGESEVEAMLRWLVLGEAPGVMLAGRRHAPGRASSAPYRAVAASPLTVPFLAALARFHVALGRSAADHDGPGRRRGEPHVVTRRNLLSVLDYVQAHGVSTATLRAALVRYYVDRCPAAERTLVLQLLDAAGIGPRTWTLAEAA